MIGVRLFLVIHRRSIIGLVFLALGLGMLQASGYEIAAGHSAAEQQAFGRQTHELASQLAYLTPVPKDLSTLGGYITWRVFGALPLMFGLWVVWFATSALRGSEEKHLTETLLGAAVSRHALIAYATGAFATAAVATVSALCIGLAASSAGVLGGGRLLLQGGALIALLTFIFGLGSLASQLGTTRRSAFALGAVALFVLNFINSMGTASKALAAVRWVSPLSWYSSSDPLVRGGVFSASGTIGLLGLGAALVALAAVAFHRRGVAQPLVGVKARTRQTLTEATAEGWYRHPVVGALYEQRMPLAWWVTGIIGTVMFFVGLAPGMVAALEQIPQLHKYLSTITGNDIERGVIGLFLIGTVQLELALFAVSAVARWAGDDASGRLELELSTPVSRSSLVARRAATMTAGAGLLSMTALAVMFVLAGARGIHFGPGRSFLAAILMVPFTLALAAVGSLWTSWRPQGAVFVLTAVAVTSYFIQEVTPLYGWSERLLDFSVFHLYGNPLVNDPDPGRIAVLIGICLVGFGGSAYLARSRDVGR
ncbi:MAG: hypothetical protein H0T12_04655 [Actinobacteria bacterium]|nr:hypothetical protein [Actinomycetota bacterium]